MGRRFAPLHIRACIYAPAKLDPHNSSWMANKFQSAMPGALLGTDQVIAYMLQHFWLLYADVIQGEVRVVASRCGRFREIAMRIHLLFAVGKSGTKHLPKQS